VQSYLEHVSNLYFIAPLSYNDLLTLINHSSVLISDSGGIQEEAAILGKKIIVLREETERIEIIEAGIGVLVGSDKEKIIETFCKMADFCDTSSRQCVQHIYGVPGVSKTILEIIKKVELNLCH
jgi:UDP-N-acetylglucosamine 2-epimerase (non-hydrolysing)